MDGVALAAAVEVFCDDLPGDVGQIVIELDGPGVSVYDQLKLGRYRGVVKGIHTGARLKDNKHYNQRARLWMLGREYMAEGGVRLPWCPEFKAQLCAMQYSYKDGLLLIQNKRDYKKKFKRSPDRADAFILTFNPYKPARFHRVNVAMVADAEYDEFG
jgi:hypothetical protein